MWFNYFFFPLDISVLVLLFSIYQTKSYFLLSHCKLQPLIKWLGRDGLSLHYMLLYVRCCAPKTLHWREGREGKGSHIISGKPGFQDLKGWSNNCTCNGNKEVVTSEQGDWCLLSSDLRNFYQQMNANYQICKGIFPTKEPTPCGHVSLYFPCTRTCVLLCLEGTQICLRSMNDGWWGPIKGIDLMSAVCAVPHSIEGVWVLLSFAICIYFCVELIFTVIPLLSQLLHFHLQIIFAWLKYNINLLDQ